MSSFDMFYNHFFLDFTWIVRILLISEYLINSIEKTELMKKSSLLLYISAR